MIGAVPKLVCTIPLFGLAMLIRAVPWHDIAFLFFCITQLGQCVASSRLTFPVLCEALRFFSVTVPCHSLPFPGSALLIDSTAVQCRVLPKPSNSVSFPIEANPPLLSSLPTQRSSKPGPRFSFLCHCQSGLNNSNALPSISNAKLVNAAAMPFISRADRSSAELCHCMASPRPCLAAPSFALPFHCLADQSRGISRQGGAFPLLCLALPFCAVPVLFQAQRVCSVPSHFVTRQISALTTPLTAFPAQFIS